MAASNLEINKKMAAPMRNDNNCEVKNEELMEKSTVKLIITRTNTGVISHQSILSRDRFIRY